MNTKIDASEKWLSFALAFVGGWSDASGFLIAKTFTGHVTGNLVLASIAIASGNWRGIVAHFSAVLCFLLGIPLNAFITRLATRLNSCSPLVASVALELILVLSACLALVVHTAASVPLFVTFLALALGLQNASFRSAGAISLHTTYLTGTITSLLAAAMEGTSHQDARTPSKPDPKSRLILGVCGTFVFGAAMGAGIVLRSAQLGLLGLAISLIIILIWLGVSAGDNEAGTVVGARKIP